MGLLAIKERAARPWAAFRPAPVLELVEAATDGWDAVLARLRASWGFTWEDELALRLCVWPEDRREAFEERAGVLEDAGFPREEAERRALAELKVFPVRVDAKGSLGMGGAAR